MKRMNKRGNIATFITQSFVVAVGLIILYVLLGGIFVSAGGIGKLFDVSKLLIAIPSWAWIVLALIILVNLMFNRKRK